MIEPTRPSLLLKDMDGIIVGSNQLQEWLLPWWWENYARHNRFPVGFVDFGMSDDGKKWCRERGELIDVPAIDGWVKDREEVDPDLADQWESRHGKVFWGYRNAWFQKPLACLQSPFKRTIWIDNDCEVRKPIDPLFNACGHPSNIALVRDPGADASPFPIYNSGVIAFQRGAFLIQEWAKQSLQRNDRYRGDQDLLSQIILEKGIRVHELPNIYNWPSYKDTRDEVVICHWLGDLGKALLHTKIILKEQESDSSSNEDTPPLRPGCSSRG